ncbi:Cytochrome monooxygenase vrtE like protein [Verticillium longisporum]|nr:Cytochrome monooxygenase vrtE like protein [Verticillium longisporum]
MNLTPKTTDGPMILAWSTVSSLRDSPTYGLSILLVAPAVAFFLWFLVSYQVSPLRRYPGPLLAGVTNFWRFWQAISADYAPRIKRLHEKYGPIVRIGPNLLDLDIPELPRTIYSTDGKWKKTDLYKISSSVVDGKITYHMFSQVDNILYARLKRPVVRHYSVPSVLAMEPHMNEVVETFCDHLQKRFVDPEILCDFGDWLAYFTWDLLGAVTFSKKFGYMEEGRDFDGTLAIADQSIDYLGICGQMPWLDHWLDKNPVYPLGPPNISNMTRIAIVALTARLAGENAACSNEKLDFLQYFIESKTSHPEIVDESTIIGYLLLNLIAGADTTAITMKALFYYCLKDLLRETLRYHPAVSMGLERIVPEGGLVLPDGTIVPAGTFVGMNPYIVGRNKGMFGADADEFRPDRWLQGDNECGEAYKERIQLWNAANLAFGGGSRICLGRHFSLMEVYKVVPSVISRFDVELADPNEKWWTCSRWFYRTKGIVCKLKARRKRPGE